ncbi:PREDICTED: uncharacterized protein LOC106804906 [Priapulus caudatus]|uniref:Uncharacterized protein LOC106804906 n=1 Tax=Priapulus caudatus TaxID=37621 RepID=A0ABM1DPB6_PRICU|nr:PREDICTED: uncharacterized protein LOC106804906 [Priapulus caudatus]
MAEHEWNKFKKEINAKRMKKKTGKEKPTRETPDDDTIVVQRLSAEVSGKAQKYARVGAREFVAFNEYEEFTVDNIKSACIKHFDIPQELMCCDVLAGEQGPSCYSAKQIPDFKVIHVRFVERTEVAEATTSHAVPQKRSLVHPSNPSPSKRARLNVAPSKFVPRSLSVVEILRLGKAIKNASTSVSVESFDMRTMAWSSKPAIVDFSIENRGIWNGRF